MPPPPPHPHRPVGSQPRALIRDRTAWALGAGLVLLVVAVFAPALRHDFVDLDDAAYVFMNEHVRTGLGWENVLWAFSAIHSANWHPLTWLSLQLDVSLWGYGAAGHHATNLVLHAAATLALFAVLLEATGARVRSAVVAALFGVHPLHVESVAWIAERKDVLSALFWMASLWTWQRFARRRTLARYLAVVLAFVLGLLSKPMVVTLPVVLLAWDLWPLGRFQRERWQTLVTEKLPLLALSAVSSAVTVYAQSSSAVVSTSELSLPARLALAVTSYGWYLRKAVWPSGLAAFYPYTVEPAWLVALSAGAGVLITAAVMASRKAPLVTGWAWYAVTLLPVIGLVQVGAQARADRYSYLPLVGVFVMLAWAISPRDEAPVLARLGRGGRIAALAVMAAALGAYAAAARIQVGHWRDGVTLWERALAVTDGNWFAHNGLGSQLAMRGRFQEAEVQLREAARLAPENPDVWLNLGVLNADTERWPEAEACLRRSLALRDGWPQTHYNLGRVLQMKGDLEGAIGQYGRAIALAPGHADAHNNLCAVHLVRGELDAAAQRCRDAAQLAPRSHFPHLNLALVHLYRGELEAASAELQAVRALGEQVPPSIEQEFQRVMAAPRP